MGVGIRKEEKKAPANTEKKRKRKSLLQAQMEFHARAADDHAKKYAECKREGLTIASVAHETMVRHHRKMFSMYEGRICL